jgi:hypothetical protein
MKRYRIYLLDDDNHSHHEDWHEFANDDEAIKYAAVLVKSGGAEVWDGSRLVTAWGTGEQIENKPCSGPSNGRLSSRIIFRKVGTTPL